MDWLAIIQERGEVTQKLAREVPPMLKRDDITEDDLTRLFASVDRHTHTIEEIVDRLDDEDEVDEELLQAAETLAEMCNDLTDAIALRLAEVRRTK